MVDLCGFWSRMGPRAGRYFVDELHPNAQGHALVAGLIFHRLVQLGWVAVPKRSPGAGRFC